MTNPPLSSRVQAPQVTPPADTDRVIWRPMRLDDLDDLVSLSRAIALADHPNYVETREEIAEELGHSYVNLERDSLIAIDAATGMFTAHGLVIMPPGQDTLVRSLLFGGVHPDRRGEGIGRTLLAWEKARGLQHLASSDKTLPGWLMLYNEERVPSAARLYARFDFEPTRWFLGQQRNIADPIPSIELPAGIRLETFSADLSDAALEAKNASFQDHWGSQPSSIEQWNSMLALPSFRAEHSFLAMTDANEVVGVLITDVVEDDWELAGYSSGYIAIVGVVREWRRKGIAPALLARAFESYRAAGFDRAELDVDSDNPSGALGLYQGMGFTETTRQIAFTQVY